MDRAGLCEADRKFISERINLLPNLQLLNGPENTSKSAMLPRQWIESSDAFACDRSRDSYADLQELGDWRMLPENLCEFRDFYETRRKRIVARLKSLLSSRRLPESRSAPNETLPARSETTSITASPIAPGTLPRTRLAPP